jgi:hypothetical protein
MRCCSTVQQDAVQLRHTFRAGGHEDLADFMCAKVAERVCRKVSGLGFSLHLHLDVLSTVGIVICIMAWVAVVTACIDWSVQLTAMIWQG